MLKFHKQFRCEMFHSGELSYRLFVSDVFRLIPGSDTNLRSRLVTLSGQPPEASEGG